MFRRRQTSKPERAVEMPARGKSGKPTAGFPLFPPPLEIPVGFPHFHRLGYDGQIFFCQRPMRHAQPQSQPEPSPVRKGLVNYVPGTKCKGCPGPLTFSRRLWSCHNGLPPYRIRVIEEPETPAGSRPFVRDERLNRSGRRSRLEWPYKESRHPRGA